MLRTFDYLGRLKWPSLALVTIAPVIAYTQWLPPPEPLRSLGRVTIMAQVYRIDGAAQDNGDMLLSVRPVVGGGETATAAPVRLVEAGWDVEGPLGNWQEGQFASGAAVITLPPRPAAARTLTIRMETVADEDAVAVLRLPARP